MSDHLIAEAHRHASALTTERDQLRADRDYNHECINRLASATGTLGEKSEKIVDVALSTIEQLRSEVESLHRIANAIEKAGKEQGARAERAEAEVAGIRALADRRNKRDHSADTTHQLVVALDQALDIAQAELAATKSTLDEEVNCAEKAEHEVVRQYARAERAEAELAGIRALADRRNKRDHAQDTTHQLVAALDQALDIAQANLAADAAKTEAAR